MAASGLNLWLTRSAADSAQHRRNQRVVKLRLRSVLLVNLRVLLVGASLLALEDLLAVGVELKGGDSDVAWVDGDLSLLTVGLLLNDFLNVNASASAVDGVDLALDVLVGAVHDADLVVLAHGEGSHLVLVLQVLGQVRAHHDATHR